MHDTHTLTRHRDIQTWVSERQGMPAIARVRNNFGDWRARLCLSFERQRRSNENRAKTDDGMSPCSWSAWLAELDRQNLALKVSTSEKPEFELVARHEMS